MTKKKVDLYWEDNLIGVIKNPNVDNFDLYGEWQPIHSKHLIRFIRLVQGGGVAAVALGEGEKPTGTVEIEPDEIIEVKIRF